MKEIVKELLATEKQLSIDDEYAIQFKNDKERLVYVENPKNWIIIYQNPKFKTRMKVFRLKHLKFIRFEVMVTGQNWYRAGEQFWIDVSTRRILANDTQTHETFTDNQIVQLIKSERSNL